MPTSEEVGRAIEEAVLRQEFNRSPFGNLKSEDILNETQLNQKIMRPEWDSSKLMVVKPKMTVEQCWVPEYDNDGKPVLFKGQKVVKPKQVKVFEGWEKQELDLPVKNLFKADLTTAISSPDDLAMINKMGDLILQIVELSVATEEDYSYDLYKFYNLMGVMLNSSKSRGGKTLEMLKTQINKGEQTSTIKQMLLQDKRRQGVFGKIKGFFNK